MPRRPIALSGVVLLVLALLALPLRPSSAWGAADEPPRAARAGGEDPRRARSSRGPMLVVLRISEALGLSDEQTVKLAREFRRIAEERRALLADRSGVKAKLEAELARTPPDDAALTASTERLVAIEHALVRLPEKLWTSIQPLLTVEQRARLVLLRGELKQQIDGERRRRNRSGRRGDGRGATAD